MDIKIEEYSEKSFVVSGENTKDYKEDLKSLGGKWNSCLKRKDTPSETFGGWIFFKDKRICVDNWFKDLKKKPNFSKNIEPNNIEKRFDVLESKLNNILELLHKLSSSTEDIGSFESCDENEIPIKRLLKK